MANLLIFFSTVRLLNACGKVESALLILKSWKIVELKRKTCWKFCGKLEENRTAKIFQKSACWNCWNRKSDFRGKLVGKDFRHPEKFPKFRAIPVFPQIVENAVESLRKVCGKPQKRLEIGTFFSLKSAHFSRKNGLYRHNPAAYCGICSRFFKTGNRKFVCIKWKNEARKTAIHLPLMGLGFDVFDDIFYQLL